MPVILQTRLPDAQTGTPGLPGTGPCGAEDWLLMDEAYAPQMVYREALLAERPEAVFYQSEAARPAAAELLSEALTLLPRFGFTLGADAGVCPFAPTGARSRWTGRNRCGRWRIWCKKTSASCKSVAMNMC